MLRYLTAGESHGPALVGILDGLPSGIELTTEDFRVALRERRAGHGRGARQKFEQDEVRVLGGMRHGRTTGAPLALLIENSEWPKWQTVMSADPVPSEALLINAGTGDEREIARNKPLTRPRPGHADLTGMLSYDLDDARDVLERASARESAMRVGLGAAARAFLFQAAGIELVSFVRSIGAASLPETAPLPLPAQREQLGQSVVRCLDETVAKEMIAQIDQAHRAADTVGGVVEVLAYHLPPGLGTHVQWDRRLDSALARELMSIQAVKGVEVGAAWWQARSAGSQAHDQIVPAPDGTWQRLTNHAGGVEGGASNGNVLRVRCALKPISTVPQALATLDLATNEPARALHQRSDACAVVPAALIAEAQVALVLAREVLERFGGNSVGQVRDALDSYRERVAARVRFASPEMSAAALATGASNEF